MRRLIFAAASAFALAGALAIGPFGAAAAAPYVYGCTPITFAQSPLVWHMLSIYNGSASPATLKKKILAGNGTVLNPSPINLPVTTTLPATHTVTYVWANTGGTTAESNDSVPASIRIVSNVPISATVSDKAGDSFTTMDWIVIPCSPQQP